jgi:hypothetical protein
MKDSTIITIVATICGTVFLIWLLDNAISSDLYKVKAEYDFKQALVSKCGGK